MCCNSGKEHLEGLMPYSCLEVYPLWLMPLALILFYLFSARSIVILNHGQRILNLLWVTSQLHNLHQVLLHFEWQWVDLQVVPQLDNPSHVQMMKALPCQHRAGMQELFHHKEYHSK
jgi:hypothetical protein